MKDKASNEAGDRRLHWLAQQGAEGLLSGDEAKEFSELLTRSQAARNVFAGYCQLLVALESEPSLHEVMVESVRPDNVVPLPGSRTILERGAGGGLPARDRGHIWETVAMLSGAAAAVVALGIYLSLDSEKGIATDGGGIRSDRVQSETQPSLIGSAAPAPAPIGNDPTPEEQYQTSPILARLTDGGSQSRPPTQTVSAGAKAKISFNRDIRPLLSDNCFHCHGPDEKARKAKLRLDLRQTTIASESNPEAPIIPGQPESSEFFARIASADPDEKMPPTDSHKRLTPVQVDLFRRWIVEGAEWEEHWAFRVPTPVEAPIVAGTWGRNEIDRFVLARLEAEGLKPSAEADRHTLIRRATFDLTGLPPTPQEIEAYLTDASPDAYEKVIERLLESRSYGEHRGRYWLDAARYADTHGLHLDNYREIWPYRDWVIRAFNDNMPYDQFTIEQLAGDLLPDATQSQIVATGFNRCNVTTSEGGAIAEEFLARYAVDRVATTATVWMGLTAGCAQCHNHKYDPLSMKEFYSLFAYFNNTTQPGMDGNAKDSAPVVRVYASDAEKARAEELRGQIGQMAEREVKAAASAGEAGFAAWRKLPDRAERLAKLRLPGTLLEDVKSVEGDEALDLGAAGEFGRDRPFSVAFSFEPPTASAYQRSILVSKTDPAQEDRGWRVIYENEAMTVHLIEEWPNKTLRLGVTRIFRAGKGGHVTVTYDGSGTSEGIAIYVNGTRQGSRFVNKWFDTMEGDFLTAAPLRVGGKDPESGLTPKVRDVRLFDRRLTDVEVKLLTDRERLRGMAAKPDDTWAENEAGELRQAWLLAFDEGYRSAWLRKSEAETALSALEAKTPVSLVMEEKPGGTPKANILDRGEYDRPLDEVPVGVPEFLPPMPEDAPGNRLGLARWLVGGEHPLTARVVVNRMWQELFGVGLVKTSEDFGTQGEPPSHPELLDWLAIHFVESGWDMKGLYRDLMLSSAYRQSARMTPELRQRDPENRLLARGPRFRLDAEMLRDQALAASGLLDPAIGGESVKPWQPGGIWEAVGYTNSNTQTFYQDYGGPAEHRRSLYTFWKRTASAPNLAVFDAPNRESCTVRRERTNTPLQALVLMNDPQYLRATRHLALRALNERDNADGRIDFLATLLMGRPLDESERGVVKASLVKFQNAWSSDEPAAREFLVDPVNDRFSLTQAESPVELASWAMVASQIMNLDESISKP
jgi:hypothetical protein